MTVHTKALAAMRREQMLPPGASVAVGLSGGADSVALLHLLLSLRKELSLCEVTAVHINHGLRGEEAERDQRFVEELCARWSVPLTVHCCDVAALASEQRIGVEEAGRAVRYEQFEMVAARINGYVATAHTASDNVETLLLHLCRGTGLHGLAGIPPVRGRIVRPLIDCTRGEIEAYCAENGLSYVTDSTNTDVAYARNRIRQLVVPQLKAINPQAESAITRLIGRAREWDVRLAQQTQETLRAAAAGEDTYHRKALVDLQPEVQAAALRHLLGEHGRQRGSERHIRLAAELLRHGGRLSVPGGRQMTVTGEYVRFAAEAELLPTFCYDSVMPGDTWQIGSDTWQLLCLSREDYEQKLNISKIGFSNACDCGKINGCLCLRQRLEGDKYHPAGRGCGKTLKKLLNEAGMSASERAAMPILCDEEGIVLVAGFGCDERVRITSDTETVLVLKKMEDV